MERKRYISKEDPDHDSKKEYYEHKLASTSMFLYDNEVFQKEEKLEYKHRIFKNVGLL